MPKKAKKKKPSDSSRIVLDGKVYWEDLKNGKVVNQEEIDGKVVLDCILAILKQYLDTMAPE